MTAATALRWQDRAACRDAPADDFFPVSDPLSDAYAREAASALAVCRSCPVRTPCLKFAVDTRAPEGIWGGTTETERRGALSHLTRGAA